MTPPPLCPMSISGVHETHPHCLMSSSSGLLICFMFLPNSRTIFYSLRLNRQHCSFIPFLLFYFILLILLSSCSLSTWGCQWDRGERKGVWSGHEKVKVGNSSTRPSVRPSPSFCLPFCPAKVPFIIFIFVTLLWWWVCSSHFPPWMHHLPVIPFHTPPPFPLLLLLLFIHKFA